MLWHMPNFTPIGATCRPCGAKNINWPLSKRNTGRFALRAMLPVIKQWCGLGVGKTKHSTPSVHEKHSIFPQTGLKFFPLKTT